MKGREEEALDGCAYFLLYYHKTISFGSKSTHSEATKPHILRLRST